MPNLLRHYNDTKNHQIILILLVSDISYLCIFVNILVPLQGVHWDIWTFPFLPLLVLPWQNSALVGTLLQAWKSLHFCYLWSRKFDRLSNFIFQISITKSNRYKIEKGYPSGPNGLKTGFKTWFKFSVYLGYRFLMHHLNRGSVKLVKIFNLRF